MVLLQDFNVLLQQIPQLLCMFFQSDELSAFLIDIVHGATEIFVLQFEICGAGRGGAAKERKSTSLR